MIGNVTTIGLDLAKAQVRKTGKWQSAPAERFCDVGGAELHQVWMHRSKPCAEFRNGRKADLRRRPVGSSGAFPHKLSKAEVARRGSEAGVLKQLILSSTIAAALPTGALAQAGAPETLTRTGNWIVDYDRDACHLLAQFGTGEDMLLMRLTRYEPGESFDFSLYGRKLASADARSEATVDFGLRGTPVEAKTMNGTAGKLPMMMFGSTRLDGWEGTGPEEIGPSLSPQQEAAISGVTVKIGRKKPFHLQFGSLAKPMAQLRACQTDLMKSWGYDPAVQTNLARPVQPANSPASWVSPKDYPSGAAAMGQNGMVQFRLDVDTEGKVAGCHVLARTSPDVFADTTCRAVAGRAKLKPALDAHGKPVRSFYVQKVRWQVGQ